MNAANAAISLAQGLVYHDGGLVEHLVQSLGGDEGLGVHLVDVLGAGGAGGEPVVLGGDLQTADLGVVARCLGQLGGDVFASQGGGGHVVAGQCRELGLLLQCGRGVDALVPRLAEALDLLLVKLGRVLACLLYTSDAADEL